MLEAWPPQLARNVVTIIGLQSGSIIMFLGVAALLVGCAIGAGAIRQETEPS